MLLTAIAHESIDIIMESSLKTFVNAQELLKVKLNAKVS